MKLEKKDRSEIIAQQIMSIKAVIHVQYGVAPNNPEFLDIAHAISTNITALLLAEICEGELVEKRQEHVKAKEEDKESPECINCRALRCSTHQSIYDKEPGQSIKNK